MSTVKNPGRVYRGFENFGLRVHLFRVLKLLLHFYKKVLLTFLSSLSPLPPCVHLCFVRFLMK
jgi:hypothetical protein